jgi:small conductance mechanosensitive channel
LIFISLRGYRLALRRVGWTFGIAYRGDADNACKVLQNLLVSDTRILAEPKPFVALRELADSLVDFTVRVWVKKEDYWAVFFNMNREVYQAFPKYGLNIPFPQMDVHLHPQKQC